LRLREEMSVVVKIMLLKKGQHMLALFQNSQ
jgi:hypothetical protein